MTFTGLLILASGFFLMTLAVMPGFSRRWRDHRFGPARVFYGWWIVAFSLVIDSFKHGTFNRGISFYVLPLSNELGVGVAGISFADVLGRLTGGVAGPVVGYLTDRLGPRTMLTFGGVISGLGFILLSFTNSYRFFLLVFVGLLSMGFRTGYNNSTAAALNQWFRRRRALAMSVASIGTGLGGVALAPMVGLLVLKLGWRTAARISGIGILAVVVPLALLVRNSPESMGLLPDGDRVDRAQPNETGARAGSSGQEPPPVVLTPPPRPAVRAYRDPDFTAREAMWTSSYWLLVLAVGLRNTVHSGLSFLLVPVLVWFLQGSGRSETDSLAIAIPLVGALSLATMVFNPLVGWLGDSWSKLKLSAVTMVAGVLSVLLLMDQSGRVWQATLFVILLSFSESSNPLAWAILGDFFGRRSFATLRGWQHLPDQFMSAATPWWMGLIFDYQGSYVWALVPLVVLYGLSAIIFLIVPVPTPPVRSNAQSQADAIAGR